VTRILTVGCECPLPGRIRSSASVGHELALEGRTSWFRRAPANGRLRRRLDVNQTIGECSKLPLNSHPSRHQDRFGRRKSGVRGSLTKPFTVWCRVPCSELTPSPSELQAQTSPSDDRWIERVARWGRLIRATAVDRARASPAHMHGQGAIRLHRQSACRRSATTMAGQRRQSRSTPTSRDCRSH
jgi:hypothetical protein